MKHSYYLGNKLEKRLSTRFGLINYINDTVLSGRAMPLISTSPTFKAHEFATVPILICMLIGLTLVTLASMTDQAFAQNIEIRPQSGVAPLRPQAPVIPDSARNQRNLPKIYQPLKKNDGIKPALSNNPDANKALPLASHQRWCSEQYKSYDIKTNNYRPSPGTIRKCVSPFSSNQSSDGGT